MCLRRSPDFGNEKIRDLGCAQPPPLIVLLFSVSVHRESEGESCSVVSNSWRPCGPYSPWNSPGQDTGVGGLSLLQGIFPTQGLNPDLHCRWILYQLSHQGSPRILEWAAFLFFSGSSQSRNRTGVTCIAGGFLPTELSGKPSP